jgi:excisionase family DNA binding protein
MLLEQAARQMMEAANTIARLEVALAEKTSRREDPERFLTVGELGKLTGYSESKIRSLIDNGSLVAIRDRGCLRISEGAYRDYVRMKR